MILYDFCFMLISSMPLSQTSALWSVYRQHIYIADKPTLTGTLFIMKTLRKAWWLRAL